MCGVHYIKVVEDLLDLLFSPSTGISVSVQLFSPSTGIISVSVQDLEHW
jgi:hypothetical protein